MNVDYGLRVSGTRPGGRSGGTIKRFDVCVLLLIFCVFSSVVTQEYANLLGFHAALGQAWPGGIYPPWGYLVWGWQFDLSGHPQAASILQRYGAVAVLVFGLYAVFVQHLRRGGANTPSESHGSARFANLADAQRMGLTDNDGVVLGAFERPDGKQVMLRHDGPEHVLMVAPTGSGKGVSVVNPTLLTWPHSCVVYDLKKENWALSSRWRKEYGGNVVLRFEPACNDGSGARYNPLAEVRLGTDHDIQDVQNIAAIIMDYGAESTRQGGSNDYFVSAGYSLLVAWLLHTCYEGQMRGKTGSLPDVADAMSDPGADYGGLMLKMGTTLHLGDRPHPLCEREAQQLISMLNSGAGKQFAGIFDMVRSNLALYADPITKKNISHSDFRLVDLMNHEKPVTLYVCVGSTDKTRLRPLTRLLFSQIVRTLTREVEFDHGIHTPSYKHKLLLLIDEFPSLGRMAIMNEAIAFLRGYGIKCLLIIQDFTQLRDQGAYGRDEAITANCGVRIAFAPNTIATAKELSEMTGTTTITNTDVSSSGSRRIFAEASGNVSQREMSRSLLTPDEVMRLRTVRVARHKKTDKETVEAGDSLVFLVGEPVIYGRQILHFEDPVLSARAQLGALDESDTVKHETV